MEGFEAFRIAAREGIARGGGQPIMAEDWPSQGRSSRTACLDLVASSDALVLVLGARGGWTAPSGMLVVEEEFREAVQRKLPVRVFLQEGVARDADAERLATLLSDYVEGYFRRTFTTPETLTAEVKRAVAEIDPLPEDAQSAGTSSGDVRRLALGVADASPGRAMERTEKTLRFVLAPERAGEVIDPHHLDDPVFHHAVMTEAQHPDHQLLDYGQPVVPRVRSTTLVVERATPEQSWRDPRPARLEVHEHGLILVDVSLELRSDPGGIGMIPPHVLDEARIESVLTAAFRFAGAIYERVDPYRRFDRFRMDVAFHGVQGCVLERSPQPRSSYTIPWRQDAAGPLTPLETPRIVSRHDLGHPDDEVSRLITYLRRALAT